MAKLRVLCLHGSRQDGEVFSQRIQKLSSKLSDQADCIFVDAPHELPLDEGQSVAMRAWWRHWALADESAKRSRSFEEQVADALQGLRLTPDQRMAAEAHAQHEHQHEVAQQLAEGGWGARITADWDASLQMLRATWVAHNGFDAILGFSNGAAAGFLLAAHVLGSPQGTFPGRRLRAVVLAGGYTAEPLAQLLPEGMAVEQMQVEAEDSDFADGGSSATAEKAGTWSADMINSGKKPSADGTGKATAPAAIPPWGKVLTVLSNPLKVASLHIMSTADKVVPEADSRILAHQFDAGRRQILEHDQGHCVPSKAIHLDIINDFLSWFDPPADEVAPTPVPASVLTPVPASPMLVAPAAVALAKPVATPAPAAPQPAGPAAPTYEASEEQLDEMEALSAIFGTSYQVISTAPPKFRLFLRDPSEPAHAEDVNRGPLPPGVRLTAAHFALVMSLPQGYPAVGGPLPIVDDVECPLGSRDPLRADLLAHVAQAAREEVDVSGSGCVFQMVEAAKEWLATALEARAVEAASIADGAKGGAAAGVGRADQEHAWWEEDEADGSLIAAAIAAASASQWAWVDSAAEGWGQVGGEAAVGAADLGATSAADGEAASSSVTDDADGLQRGRWDFVVGLVGKPSAGKSSFFNAVTTEASGGEEGARVAAHPFTTIAPNIARGFVPIPDPSRVLGLDTSKVKPTHGFAPAFDPSRADPALNNIAPLTRWVEATGWGAKTLWRRVPVTVKDVAGLVPGAYAGRGRGNAFLNDLCDADVLIHVVDASGCTDKEGRPASEGEGADPVEDIQWVREELHRWVWDNVRAKWAVVRRRPTRLADLFSGYHSSRALVAAVLERVGVPLPLLAACEAGGPGVPGVGGRPGGPPKSPLLSWGPADLHRLVATFLAARFPLLLALNKSDLPPAAAHIARVRTTLPLEPVVAVSAASERWLTTARTAGNIVYEDGGATASVVVGKDVDAATARRIAEINARVLGRFGSSGAMLALATAVAMRPPRVVFPVADVVTCTALPSKIVASGMGTLMGAEDAKLRAAEGSNTSPLRDAMLLKPGSTPYDVYGALKRPPWQLLEGEYVRAEARRVGGSAGAASSEFNNQDGVDVARGVLKKDERLEWSNCVLRVMTNRKSNWQR